MSIVINENIDKIKDPPSIEKYFRNGTNTNISNYTLKAYIDYKDEVMLYVKSCNNDRTSADFRIVSSTKVNKERPSWHEYFLNICDIVATRSSCLRRQIGAIIVKDNRQITAGYNGAPSGIINCIDRGYCLRDRLNIPSGQNVEKCYACHAEQNAILQAARNGISLLGSTLYVTTSPCSLCVKSIIQVGIVHIIVRGERYPDDLAEELLKEAGIKVEYM